jgi:hypothetical protein
MQNNTESLLRATEQQLQRIVASQNLQREWHTTQSSTLHEVIVKLRSLCAILVPDVEIHLPRGPQEEDGTQSLLLLNAESLRRMSETQLREVVQRSVSLAAQPDQSVAQQMALMHVGREAAQMLPTGKIPRMWPREHFRFAREGQFLAALQQSGYSSVAVESFISLITFSE